MAESITFDLITEASLEEEGTAATDASRMNRWLGCFKKAVKLVWDSRAWGFKQVVDEAFTFDPSGPVALPDDYGDFETMGAGIYYQNPKYQILPWFMGQMTNAKYGQPFQGGAQPRRYSIKYGDDGAAELLLFPQPPQTVNLTLVYLRRSPILTLDSSDDEIGFIPAKWHSVIDSGARWINLVKDASKIKEDYHEIFTAALQSMADRERWGGPGLDHVAKWVPSRMSSIQ